MRAQDAALEAFREGLALSLPVELLPLFTAEEAERLVCGAPRIDLGLLKRVTQYEDGVSADSPFVGFFWRALEGMGQEQRAKFIQFAWARSRLPSSADAFSMPFKITAASAAARRDPDAHLPTSQTCFFSVSLPPYTRFEACRDKLAYAINNTPTMDADVIERSATGYEDLGGEL
jgi:hypothetical protein